MSEQSNAPLDCAVQLTCAYLAHNAVPAADVPGLLAGIHAALSGLALGEARPAAEATAPKPSADQIRKSIRPDGLVSFIDGKSYQTLKRHLTVKGLSPDQYRRRYGLPPDYPMVASGYAARRSELAKAIGLGTHRKAA